MFYKFILLMLLTCCYATQPPGHVKPPEDKFPPKYEYGYNIEDNKGSGQGKLETRDGVFSLGRYYVQLGAGLNGASQNVEYITDEWGYHPLVEYSSNGAHSQTSTQFALGEKAVEALRKNNKNQPAINSQIKQIALNGIPLPSPVPSTTAQPIQQIPTKPLLPPASPAPTISNPNFKIHHPFQENVPALQNALPIEYLFQSINIPQAQYLIQPQIINQGLPQESFYITEQNYQQHQPIVIPLYESQLGVVPHPEMKNHPKVDKELVENNEKANEKIHLTLRNNVVVSQNNNKNANNLETPNIIDRLQEVQSKEDVREVVIKESYSIDNSIKDHNQGQFLVELNSQTPKYQKLIAPKIESKHQNNEQLKTNEYLLPTESSNTLFRNELKSFSLSPKFTEQNLKEKIGFDESILNLEHPGGYGSKINSKKSTTSKNTQDFSNNLIDRTRNLVNGYDVLSINDAASNSVSSENKNVISEYNDVNYNVNVPNTILEALTNVHHKDKSEEETNNPNKFSSNLVTQLVKEETQVGSFSTYLTSPRSNLIEILNSEKSFPVQRHISLAEKPIVVAEFDENLVQLTAEGYTERTLSEKDYSTTQNTIETKVTADGFSSTETPILVTPRPVSNAFLAPITAAVSLKNSGQTLDEDKEKILVEIQKSVPYYLGKIEYIENQENNALSTKLYLRNISSEGLRNDVQSWNEQDSPRAEALIQTEQSQNSVKFIKPEQDQIQTEHDEIAEDTKIVNKATEVIGKPYTLEVKVPVEVPVAIPYPVERIVEKPIEVTRIVEKPVPVHVPQPYPVEVEKIVEKEVQVPFEVTKYVEKPVAVHVPYPQPIAIPVEVQKLVRTIVKEPYPVEVPIRIEVPVKVPVPHPVPVTKYIEKPYAVEKIVERPIQVERIVEKPVTKYVDKPYPVPVHIPVPHPIAIPVEIKIPQPYPHEIGKYFPKPYENLLKHNKPPQRHPVTKLVQIPTFVPPISLQRQHQQNLPQNPYLYAPKYQLDWKDALNCDLTDNKYNHHRFAKQPEYIGLVPPQKPFVDHIAASSSNINKNYKRRPRNSFMQNLRMEYGFKPPMVPSVQTDEFGMPLNGEN